MPEREEVRDLRRVEPLRGGDFSRPLVGTSNWPLTPSLGDDGALHLGLLRLPDEGAAGRLGQDDGRGANGRR